MEINVNHPAKILQVLIGIMALICVGAHAASECGQGEDKIFSGHFTEGIELTSRCLAQSNIDKETRARALQVRAWAHFSLRQDSQAVSDQESAFKLKGPSDYREFMNYGSYLRRVKRYQDSLKALRSAEEIDMKNGSVSMMTQYNLGWTLFELGRHEEAIKAFSLGIPKQPDYPFVYWRRGLAHEAMGNKTLAKIDFEAAGQRLIANKDKWRPEDLKDLREKFSQYGLEKKYPI